MFQRKFCLPYRYIGICIALCVGYMACSIRRLLTICELGFKPVAPTELELTASLFLGATSRAADTAIFNVYCRMLLTVFARQRSLISFLFFVGIPQHFLQFFRSHPSQGGHRTRKTWKSGKCQGILKYVREILCGATSH
jgi:hypothetical protein